MKRYVVWFFLLSVLLFSFVACNPKSVEYQLEVKVEGRGQVTPQKGKFKKDQIIIFELEPAEGWQFSHWGGESVTDVQQSGDSWRLLMNGNKKLVANFIEINDNVQRKLVVAVEGDGTVLPNLGLYKNGEKVVFSLQPASGWEFSHWEGKNRNDVKQVAGKWQIIMDSDKNLTAVFGKRDIEGFLLDVTIKGEGTVTITPEKTYYDPDALVKLQASPAEGWLFKGWFGDIESEEETIEIIMTEDKNILAEFTPIRYTLNLNIEGKGRVEQRALEGQVHISYAHGTKVELTAVPADGWLFGEWQGDGEGSDPKLTLQMDEDKEVTAVFLEKPYNLEVEIVGEGTVEEKLLNTYGTKDYEGGARVQLTALAAEGWQFTEWQGDLLGSEAVMELVMDEDKKVVAIFSEIEILTYKLVVNITGEGEVTKDPEGEEYPEGTVVTLTANAKEGWEFLGWQGDLEDTEATIEIEMNGDKELTAVFKELVTYKLVLEIEGEGTVTKDPDAEEYKEGTMVTLTASPAEGWEFPGWQGALEDTEAAIEIEMDGDKELTAVFKELITYTLALEIEGEGTVSKDPDAEKYKEGTMVTLIANPAEGWEFLAWQGDLVSPEALVELEMDKDKEIVAIFQEIINHKLEIKVEGEGTVSKDPDAEEYREGTIVTLTALAKEEWKFLGWQGALTSNEATVELEMTEDKEITAVFIPLKRFRVNVNIKGRGTVSKDPNTKDYLEDSILTLTAKPDKGWKFVGWSGDLEGTEPEVEVKVTKNMRITAEFARIPHYKLLVSTVGDGTFSIIPDQTSYEEGTKVIIYAYPRYGWNPESYWDIDGERFSSSAIELIMDKDISAVAYFNSMGFDELEDQ